MLLLSPRLHRKTHQETLMSARFSFRIPKAAALGLGLLLAGASAWATPDWTTAAASCGPTTADGLSNTTIDATQGTLKRGGRNPPAAYMCAVHEPDDPAAPNTWNTLSLQTLDVNGGAANARLYAKERGTGVVSSAASVTSAANLAVAVRKTTIRAKLDFARFAYFVVLTLKPATSQEVTVHMVSLVTE
jgi:hypothetical protein